MKKKIRAYAAALLSALIIMGGYLTFRFFVANIAQTPAAYGLFVFAAAAATATFFSPCSFPLMPGYLASLATTKGTGKNVMSFGIAGALGVVSFSLLLGAAIGIVGESFAKSLAITSGTPSSLTITLRYALGAILILLGMLQYTNLPLLSETFHRLSKLLPKVHEESARGVFLYGFGYTAAGLGCAAPILAGLIVLAISSGGFLAAFSTFAVYSLIMGSLMLAMSALAGFAKKDILAKISEATPTIKKAAAIVQILVGAFLIYSTYNIELFTKLFFP